MVKKKVSSQTIAIIILAILLLLSICFGGVYAFYSAKSSRITGRILMANLKIGLVSGKSEQSEIVISNSTNIVPNQSLENTPLVIKNSSSVSVYLLLVYELVAVKLDDETQIIDDKINPVIDIGTSYVNEAKSISIDSASDSDWIDYVYTHTFDDNSTKTYRCFISDKSYNKGAADSQSITVIPENCLKLSKQMGNEYQATSISFTFQAFAISASSVEQYLNENIDHEPSKLEKCRTIIDMIYESQNYTFIESSLDI